MLLETFDALAYCSMGDVQLLSSTGEIQVARGRFKEPKRLEGRKDARHAEMIAALTGHVKNHRWQSTPQRRIIPIPTAINTNN